MRVPQRGRSRFLGRPASRSCSSTEQEPGHRGESVSDVRPILFGSSSFVGLLGSGAFMACEAREGLGSSRKSACQGVGLASRRMQRLDWGFADIFGMPRRWESACIGAKACVVSAAGTLVDAPRVRGRRRWERNAVGWSIQRVPPRAGGTAVGVRPSEKWPRAGRRPIGQLRLWQPSRARSRALASVGRAAAIRPVFLPVSKKQEERR